MPPIEASENPKPFIKRTFCDLSQEDAFDIEKASILARMKRSRGFGWDTLLKSQRVLIVSEAGAGKTYECRAQRQALWDQGEPAFYLDLAQLAANSLRDLLSADEEARLDAWLAAQSDIATFFLDSIDELKLTLGSFETALKRLGKAVAGQLSRVRIVITTRPIAIDRQLIQKHFPVPKPVDLIPSGDSFADIAMGRHQKHSNQSQEDTVPVWRNVALMPLSDEQIQQMAAVEGVDEAKALLADIRARNAEDFARRPQDLIELCADWHQHRRVRTHRDQVAHNIHVKLKPRTDRREPAQLSPDKALEGASRLALAALLTRKLTIRLSVEADRAGLGTALDPAAVLHDWTPEERETLLERALFGFASYGRVRFHHRSVIEFLAAQRLEDRLTRGMPIKAIKRLLFAEAAQNTRVVRPTMRPVAAWLAAWQPSVFSEVLDREPDVLLNQADPESLSPPQRIDALRSYVRVYGQGGWRGLHIPRVQVHRFASPELEAHVRELWPAGIENTEVRELLLELIEAGPLYGCADIAYSVATDAGAPHGERLTAVAALVRLDDPRIATLTNSIVNAPATWPDVLVRGTVTRLFPVHINPDQLCEVLKRVPASAKTLSEIDWVLPRNIAMLEFEPDYLTGLRIGLTNLVTEDLVWQQEWPHLISKHPHLLPALAASCLRLIRAGETSAEVLRSSVVVLRLEDRHRTDNDLVQDLRKALGELEPPLREAVFWADDELIQGFHPETDPSRRLFNACYDGPLSLNAVQDGNWMLQCLADTARPLAERTMALLALMRHVWDGKGQLQDHLERLKQYVSDEPELLKLIDHEIAPRTIDPEQVKLEARIKRQNQAAERRKARDHASWVAFWSKVADDPETAFSPDREGNTAWNLWQAMQRAGDESRASGWNRRFIEHHFGIDVAERLRNSMRSIWRKDRPTLRYERPANERGTILIRWQLGLAAIAAEAEDPTWARKLSVEEAELAARYAPIELNGFPAWLEALAREHPAAVERTLGPDLSAELEETATQNSFGIVLQDVGHAPDAVVQPFLPRLHAWLDAHAGRLRDGENPSAAQSRLARVLEILLKHAGDKTRKKIRDLAEKQLADDNAKVVHQCWLTTLMRLDPAAGVDCFEHLLSRLESSETDAAINAFSIMFGNRRSDLQVNLRHPGFTPPLLLRLIRLAYKHVCPADDLTHEGVYSPGPRDDAQDGRNAILSAILDLKGADAWATKLEMAKDPLFEHFRDRLVSIAREKAAEEVDSAVFTESEVITLDRYGEAPPTTRDDMFAVLIDRLDDLDDLLLQDISPRAAWAVIRDEKVMRRLIALQLHNASNDAYTVDQEAVTADEKETDIRLRVASSGQQGTIELKIGENWTGRALRDTIRSQLVAKYMAAESCRSGCLVVTVASDRKWEHPDTGEVLDIAGLRALLNAEASKVIEDLSGSLRLAVKVLDLTPRLTANAGTTSIAGDKNDG